MNFVVLKNNTRIAWNLKNAVIYFSIIQHYIFIIHPTYFYTEEWAHSRDINLEHAISGSIRVKPFLSLYICYRSWEMAWIWTEVSYILHETKRHDVDYSLQSPNIHIFIHYTGDWVDVLCKRTWPQLPFISSNFTQNFLQFTHYDYSPSSSGSFILLL